MNNDIARTTNEQFVETLDHKTDPSKLWRTIKAIDVKSPPNAENEAITFDDSQASSPKQIANYFNRQFTTSKLGRHTSSRETRPVSREIKRKSLMSAVTFTTDQVIKGISNCSNSNAFGPDKISIFPIRSSTPTHFKGQNINPSEATFNVHSVDLLLVPFVVFSALISRS